MVADLRLALDALRVAQGHIQDAVGDAGPRLPTPLQGMGIRISVLASQLEVMRSHIAAGGPVGWPSMCRLCGRVGDHGTSCPEVAR